MSDTPVKKIFYPLLFCIALLYVVFVYLGQGYGNDYDAYTLIRTWHRLVDQQVYVPTRFQGHLVPMLLVGASAELGGYFLACLLSVGLSIWALWALFSLCRHMFTSETSILVVAALATNPFWVLMSTKPTDDVYAMCFYLVAILMIVDRRFMWCAMMMALAVSSRINYLPMAVLVYAVAYFVFHEHDTYKRTIILAVFVTIGLSLCFFLPSLFYHQFNLQSFLGTLSIDTGWFGYTARFVYKNIHLWGLLAIPVWFAFFCHPLLSGMLHKKLLVSFLFVIILYVEGLFVFYPYDIEYLLPVLVCGVLLFACSRRSGLLLKWLIVVNLIYVFVNVDFLEIQYVPDRLVVEATGATPGIYVNKGILLDDLEKRTHRQNYYRKVLLKSR